MKRILNIYNDYSMCWIMVLCIDVGWDEELGLLNYVGVYYCEYIFLVYEIVGFILFVFLWNWVGWLGKRDWGVWIKEKFGCLWCI